jgi:hypothetical protein
MPSRARRAALPLPLALALLATASASASPPSVAERIRADVARLAGAEWQGRRAGTPGAEQAGEWIAAEMRGIGLAPGMPDGSFFQPFSFIDGVVLGPGTRLAVSRGTEEREFRPGEDFRPLAFSSAGTVAGDVVFAGYGIVAKDLGRDDYQGLDVKDRVVLLLRYGPDGQDLRSRWAAFMPLRFKVSTARDRGARAVLIVTGPRTADAKDELVPLRSDASLTDSGIPAFTVTRAVAETLFAGSGTTLDAAHQKADAEGAGAATALAVARLEMVADVAPKRAGTRNVVGRLDAPGATEAIVIGAHYDHLGLGMAASLDPSPDGKLHHGADDNASGVAGLLELARRLAVRRAELRRSILFVAFGAEELGTLGSSHFVKNVPPPSRVAAMVNLDMIGRLRGDAIEVHGVGSSPVWKTLVQRSARAAGLEAKTHDGGYGPSDHSPFYAAGTPVLFLFTGNHPDYHRPSDTAEKVDAAGIARVVDFVLPVIADVASASAPVAFTRVAAEKEQPSASRGFRVWVGGIPDYSGQGAGVTFTGVSPGSPAEQAGVRAGDVLVRFGAKEIRNIYDYTYALGEHRPGDRVTAVVERDGREVSLELTLQARPSASR